MNTHHKQSPGLRRTITQEVRLKIYDFMKSILQTVAEDYWEYTGDWTDEKVAIHFGIGRNSVERIRMAGFGPLFKTLKPVRAADPELVARVESLERRIVSMLSSIESHGRVAVMFERRLDSMRSDLDTDTKRLDIFYNKLKSLLED